MKRNEILNMPAGKEMDTLIVGIMGWVEIDKAINYRADMGIRWASQFDGVWKFGPGLAYLWQPSMEIHDAWEVVEKLQTSPRSWNIMLDGWGDNKKYCVEILGEPVYTIADTAPLAICRAALLVRK